MKCVDCQEEFTETELRAKVICVGCNGIMHPECAMVDELERDICEACLTAKGIPHETNV